MNQFKKNQPYSEFCAQVEAMLYDCYGITTTAQDRCRIKGAYQLTEWHPSQFVAWFLAKSPAE
jgi:hypothetical protein